MTRAACGYALAVAVVTAGCGGNGVSHRAADEYTGCGADEQYVLFEDAESSGKVTSDATQAPTVTMPAAGATVAFADKVIIAWTIDAASSGSAAGDVPYLDSQCPGCCPQWNPGALLHFPPDDMGGSDDGGVSAGAIRPYHLPAQTGDLYDLHVAVDGVYRWRVITSLQEWTPPDAQWQAWKGHTLALTIYRLQLDANVVQQGPFVAPQPFGFQVGS